MKTIWKFPLRPFLNPIEISMPEGAQILSVQNQREDPVLWALVDTNGKPEVRRFLVFGTGHPIPGFVGKHLGTFQAQAGTVVVHVFEEALT